jgi:sortase (surface protein transpeptidase)
MAPPSTPDRVGWFNKGSLPGEAGTAILDGHLDWSSGPAVFWHLEGLRDGDEVVVARADGSSARFLVASVTRYPYDVTPAGVLGDSGRPALALITCAGAWDKRNQNYQERLVVRAYYAPAPAASPPPEPN